jgi:hypothetical protein
MYAIYEDCIFVKASDLTNCILLLLRSRFHDPPDLTKTGISVKFNPLQYALNPEFVVHLHGGGTGHTIANAI